jgi:ATP/maltotriose-dependent transcriptional regulator MalT
LTEAADNGQPDFVAELVSDAMRAWPRAILLVVDDYEQISGYAASEDLIGRIVLEGVERALVATRTRPTWLTARRLTYGEVVEIDAHELALTVQEADAVFQAVGKASDRELVALADGWPAALTLAVLAEHGASTVTGAFDDFLAQEVCRALEDRVRFDLSVLAGLGAIELHVAELILGQERADASIEAAQDLGVLTHIDADRYELHPLVRDFLRGGRLESLETLDLDAVSARLVDAAHWDVLFDLAVRVDSDLLVDMLLTHGIRAALDEGRVASATRWLEFARLRRTSPNLVRLGEAELALRDGFYIQSETLGAEVAADLADGAARTWALFIAGRAAHLAGREQQAVDYYREARSSATSETDQREADWGELTGAIDLELPEAALLLERLRNSAQTTASDRIEVASRSLMLGARFGSLAALDESRDALQLLPLVRDPVATSSFRNTYAYACAIAGDYTDAIAMLDELESDAESQRLRFALPYVRCARAVVFAAQRSFDAAKNELSSATIDARRLPDHHVLAMCAAIRGRMLIALGRFDEAVSASAYRHPALIKSMHGELLVTQALAYACAGQMSDATALSREAVGLTSAVEVLGISKCVEAIESDRCGAPDADRVAGRAVDYAKASRYVDGLITAYRGYPALTRRLASDGEQADWMLSVMLGANDEQFAQIAGLGTRAGALSLSRREAEVLSLVREGLTNKEIGSRLFISEDTAKLHVYRIMKKLGVRSRTEAALRASPGDT